MSKRILIVEDDPSIRQGLELTLLKTGYEVRTAADAEAGEKLLLELNPDLLILDLMLPGRSGLEFCKRIRKRDSQLPILMLTALSDESDRILGFDLSADDYVTKPFSLRELEARIRALLRRTEASEAVLEILEFGDVRVDFKRYRAWKAGKKVHLPPKAYGVLQSLARSEGDVLSRDCLLEEVWGYDSVPTTRTVDNHVAQLRSVLEDDPVNPVYLLTVHGVGYSFTRDTSDTMEA